MVSTVPLQIMSIWMAVYPFLLFNSSFMLKKGWTAIHSGKCCSMSMFFFHLIPGIFRWHILNENLVVFGFEARRSNFSPTTTYKESEWSIICSLQIMAFLTLCTTCSGSSLVEVSLRSNQILVLDLSFGLWKQTKLTRRKHKLLHWITISLSSPRLWQ